MEAQDAPCCYEKGLTTFDFEGSNTSIDLDHICCVAGMTYMDLYGTYISLET